MKILFLLRAMAQMAGTERVMSDKMNYLALCNNDISMVTYEQGKHPIAFNLHPSIRVFDLDTRFFALKNYNILLRIVAFFRMRKRFHIRLQHVVDEIHPDIIIVTTYSLKEIDLILKIQTNAKRVLESHTTCSSIKKSIKMGDNLILKLYGSQIDKHFLCKIKDFDKLIALTKGDAKEWTKYSKNVVVIPNPLTFYPESLIQGEHVYRRIICVGRLSVEKGYDLLIPAFQLIAKECLDWRIDIFGIGPEFDNLTLMIRSLSLEHRIFINKPSQNIYEEYQKSDFLVFCSRYEGFGLVLNEAMSCGLPCVSFKCNYGPEEIITDGVNGLLVEKENVEGLASAMLWMIKHPEDRKKMGIQARESSKNFKKEIIIPMSINLFNSFYG